MDRDADLAALPTTLALLEDASGLSEAEVQSARAGVVRKALQEAIADGILTELEEQRVDLITTALAVGEDAQIVAIRDLVPEIDLARINAGRLAALPSSSLMTKRGESVYLEVPAQLLKEVVDRETRGGYSGVSFRVAKGVRVHSGGFRGHSVVVGSHVVVADGGVLSVTSSRIVFAGTRRSIEIAYTRLLGMTGFSDGVAFQVANRATQPTLRVESGSLVVAAVNAAASRLA